MCLLNFLRENYSSCAVKYNGDFTTATSLKVPGAAEQPSLEGNNHRSKPSERRNCSSRDSSRETQSRPSRSHSATHAQSGFLGTYLVPMSANERSSRRNERAGQEVTIGGSGVCSEYVRSDYHLTARYSTAGEPAIMRNQSQITLIMKGQALPVAEEMNGCKEKSLTITHLVLISLKPKPPCLTLALRHQRVEK